MTASTPGGRHTTGYPDGGYRPSSSVSRAAMSAFMYRMSSGGASAPASATFADVPTDHPFFLEVEWMAHRDITEGYSDGGFHPAAAVTRQAMSAFMHRLAGVLATQT